jgi:hypothetical protein
MQAFGEVIGAGFKFRDYYSAFRIERPQPLVVSPTDTLDTLLPHIVNYNRRNIAPLQESIFRGLEDILGTKRKAISRPFGPSALAPCTHSAIHAESGSGSDQEKADVRLPIK